MKKDLVYLASALLFGSLIFFNSCKPEDTVAPSIRLIGGESIAMFLPNVAGTAPAYVDPGFTAMDNIDKDVTNKVKVYGTVNTNVKGTYSLVYSVKDAAGNVATSKRTVYIINNADSLAGVYNVSDTTLGSPSTVAGYAIAISSDMFTNNYFHFHPVGAFGTGFGNLYADSTKYVVGIISNDKTAITIPRDSVAGIGAGTPPSETHIFTGSGTDSVGAVISTVLLLNWTDQPVSPAGAPTYHHSRWTH
ncbi:MAG TPA: DUF5011 domain-containing protein [Bacteroidia bacterium]|jgi:hypothetical protein|nr:DUF5011 domain-containing protein [Bacteroidia bacterium]